MRCDWYVGIGMWVLNHGDSLLYVVIAYCMCALNHGDSPCDTHHSLVCVGNDGGGPVTHSEQCGAHVHNTPSWHPGSLASAVLGVRCGHGLDDDMDQHGAHFCPGLACLLVFQLVRADASRGLQDRFVISHSG
jgi:hypothetical protein